MEPRGHDLVLWQARDQQAGAAGTVTSGCTVQLNDYQDGYYLVRAGELQGWIHESYVRDRAVAETETISAEPEATDTPMTAYLFMPDGPARPDMTHPRPECPHARAYIVGTVRDAAGNPVGGVRLVCYSDWYRFDVIGSKGGGDIGRYDFMIPQTPVTWYVVVLDAADNPISPIAAVDFDPDVAGRYILDWRRSY